MTTPLMLTGGEFLDAVVQRLCWHRECYAALRTARFDADEMRIEADANPARDRKLAEHRAAGHEIGALLNALGGRKLMQAVLDRAEDTYGLELTVWASNAWVGVFTGPREGDVWP